MIRQKSAVEFLLTTRKDVLRIVPTIQQCLLAPSNLQACEFSTFAIFPIPRRLLTGSQAPCGRLSFPDPCYGTRSPIERWIGWLVTLASSYAIPAMAKPKANLELWVVGADNGFQILRFTDNFKARHEDLFDDSGD